MIKDKSGESYYQHEKGRWLCPTIADAITIHEKHPTDPIYIYERDHNHNIVNIKKYWSTDMPAQPKILGIKKGKLIKRPG